MMFPIIAILTLTMMTVIIVKWAIYFSQGADHVRLTSEQAKQNRQLILETASRMFRLHGMEDVSVADIMKQSGFTHGGFYNHFHSKEELAAEAVASAFEGSAHGLSEKFASARSYYGIPQSGVSRFIHRGVPGIGATSRCCPQWQRGANGFRRRN
jgi:TetR/AcrR family transcriptional repressor of nem operon